MLKIKIFRDHIANVEESKENSQMRLDSFNTEINKWLAENPNIEIISQELFTSSLPATIGSNKITMTCCTLSIIYRV